ncbi:MAG: 6-hydroxymethylpterin diphosphokinase MptE-like protein [Promethearchaeati archaeon SRVP18_Atabeyarchaeia-1]
MEFARWMPWYEKITSSFGYSVDKDREASLVLSDLLSRAAAPLAALRRIVKGRDILILGAGPSLENNLAELVSSGLERSFKLVAADGTTSALLEESIIPHIVVTDLDGCVEDIIEASKVGATVVIHAHGDNIEALRKWVPRIIDGRKGEVFGTTQAEPSPPAIHNFGGFTDGDRGVFLAEEMEARTIVLAGMDLGKVIGKYSKNRDKDSDSRRYDRKWLSMKRLKLRFARELLEWLATWSRARSGLFNATGPRGEAIRGFARIDFRDLPRIVKATGSQE